MNIYDQLKRDEGLRLKIYPDSKGIPTIGYGRNLQDKGISQQEAWAMLQEDVAETAEALEKEGFPMAPASTHFDPRSAVLLNLGFNLGVPGLLAFKKMLAAYKTGDWETAAKEMLDSQWATQVGPRAERLAKQLREGVWV